MNAELLALLESDPVAGILAVADLREQRARDFDGLPGPWTTKADSVGIRPELAHHRLVVARTGSWILGWTERRTAEHVAAEANPEHTLSAARRWRKVVERHARKENQFGGATILFCARCEPHEYIWPCADLTETVDEARAYLGGVQ